MKNTSTLIIITLLTNLLICCSTPKELEYREFKNLIVEKINFSSTTLKMDLIYYNPNSIWLPGFSCSFSYFEQSSSTDNGLSGFSKSSLE